MNNDFINTEFLLSEIKSYIFGTDYYSSYEKDGFQHLLDYGERAVKLTNEYAHKFYIDDMHIDINSFIFDFMRYIEISSEKIDFNDEDFISDSLFNFLDSLVDIKVDVDYYKKWFNVSLNKLFTKYVDLDAIVEQMMELGIPEVLVIFLVTSVTYDDIENYVKKAGIKSYKEFEEVIECLLNKEYSEIQV